MDSSETSKAKYKRKWTPGKEEGSRVTSGSKKYDDLVGCKVEAWWSLDETHVQDPATLGEVDLRNGTNSLSFEDVKEEDLGSKFVPSITSQGVDICCETIEVGNYRVKASIVPILRVVFTKYGDIAAQCLYNSTSVRASLLEVICGLIQRLQCSDLAHIVSDLKVIEDEVSDLEAAKFEMSWLREYLDKVHEVRKFGQSSSSLKEMKGNRLLVIGEATKKLERRRMQLVAAQERVTEAEKCVNAMKIVSRKINDAILESEAEEYFWRRRLDGLL